MKQWNFPIDLSKWNIGEQSQSWIGWHDFNGINREDKNLGGLESNDHNIISDIFKVKGVVSNSLSTLLQSQCTLNHNIWMSLELKNWKKCWKWGKRDFL